MNQNYPSLGNVMMAEVILTFTQATEHVMGNYMPDSRPEIEAFVAQMVLQEKPYMLVTYEGRERIKTLVFGKESIRDFVMTLAFNFFSRLACDENIITALAYALATGTTFSGYGADAKQNQMPEAIATRLENTQPVTEILKANKWLMVILLMQLSIRMEDAAKVSGSRPPRKP